MGGGRIPRCRHVLRPQRLPDRDAGAARARANRARSASKPSGAAGRGDCCRRCSCSSSAWLRMPRTPHRPTPSDRFEATRSPRCRTSRTGASSSQVTATSRRAARRHRCCTRGRLRSKSSSIWCSRSSSSSSCGERSDRRSCSDWARQRSLRASAIEMDWLSGNVDRVYYGTDTRAQSLLVGVALAALYVGTRNDARHARRQPTAGNSHRSSSHRSRSSSHSCSRRGSPGRHRRCTTSAYSRSRSRSVSSCSTSPGIRRGLVGRALELAPARRDRRHLVRPVRVPLAAVPVPRSRSHRSERWRAAGRTFRCNVRCGGCVVPVVGTSGPPRRAARAAAAGRRPRHRDRSSGRARRRHRCRRAGLVAVGIGGRRRCCRRAGAARADRHHSRGREVAPSSCRAREPSREGHGRRRLRRSHVVAGHVAGALGSTASISSNRSQLGCGVVRGSPFRYFGDVQQEPPECATWPQDWAKDVAQLDPDVVLVVIGRWEVMDRMHDGQTGRASATRRSTTYLDSELATAVSTLSSHGAVVDVRDRAVLQARRTTQRQPVSGGRDVAGRPVEPVACGRSSRRTVQSTLVDLGGLLSPQGKLAYTINGVTVRASDGVHITPQGGRWLAPQLLPSAHPVGAAAADNNCGNNHPATIDDPASVRCTPSRRTRTPPTSSV